MFPQTPVVILRFSPLFLLVVLLTYWASWASADNGTESLILGENGLLVVTAAQDTASGYHWIDGPGSARRSLIWPSGVLSIPHDYPVEGFGAFDLAIPCAMDFGGVGDAGRLLMQDGQYRVREPVLLTDGTVYFFADDGLLEVVATRVRYFPPELKISKDPRSSFVLLAGLLILIAVLIRRSRRIINNRAKSS